MEKENYFNFHKNSPLENMMINISVEGQLEVWDSIEEINNAIERTSKRKLYFEALKKLEKGK